MDDLRRHGVQTLEIATNRLQSTARAKSLCDSCEVRNVRIESDAICYPIIPDEWWDIVNSAAYKGLLNKIGTDQL